MLRELSIDHGSLPLRSPFRISRGVRYSADVVTVVIHQGDKAGRGECVPYPRYGESVTSVMAQIEQIRDDITNGIGRAQLQMQLPAGAARNAVDTALWDLESQLDSTPVWSRLGHPAPRPLISALTVSIDSPEQMEAAASRIADAKLIKVKVDADDPVARIKAVRRAAPSADLIVDANESWNIDILLDTQHALEQAGVNLLEQPLPADADDALMGFSSSIPICADESCHVTQDLPRLRGRYQAVNIKLDKTGGLTEAWRLLHAARRDGFQIMLGCMVCSSLGIAPALEIACEAAFVDIDGPFWLKQDYEGGIRIHEGLVEPPAHGFWGG